MGGEDPTIIIVTTTLPTRTGPQCTPAPTLGGGAVTPFCTQGHRGSSAEPLGDPENSYGGPHITGRRERLAQGRTALSQWTNQDSRSAGGPGVPACLGVREGFVPHPDSHSGEPRKRGRQQHRAFLPEESIPSEPSRVPGCGGVSWQPRTRGVPRWAPGHSVGELGRVSLGEIEEVVSEKMV